MRIFIAGLVFRLTPLSYTKSARKAIKNGQSNGVSRAHAKAAQIHMEEEPTNAAINIQAEYEAKNGALGAAVPKSC